MFIHFSEHHVQLPAGLRLLRGQGGHALRLNRAQEVRPVCRSFFSLQI